VKAALNINGTTSFLFAGAKMCLDKEGKHTEKNDTDKKHERYMVLSAAS